MESVRESTCITRTISKKNIDFEYQINLNWNCALLNQENTKISSKSFCNSAVGKIAKIKKKYCK